MPLSTFKHLHNFCLNYLQRTHIWLLKWSMLRGKQTNGRENTPHNTITQQKRSLPLRTLWTSRTLDEQPPTRTPTTNLGILICPGMRLLGKMTCFRKLGKYSFHAFSLHQCYFWMICALHGSSWLNEFTLPECLPSVVRGLKNSDPTLWQQIYFS